MSLLTESQPKLEKGEALGFLSFGLHFAPNTISGYQVCASASCGCIKACLYTSGHGRFTRTQLARIAKTRKFFEQRETFMHTLVKNVEAALRRAERLNMEPAFRLNLTSDIRWENIPVRTAVKFRGKTTVYDAPNIMEAFPTAQFYDYTKHANRRNIPRNYHLTFSRSETNQDAVLEAFNNGMNVAIVFDTPKNKPLPTSWWGRPVIDGRAHDLRFLDPQGVWVGLSALEDAKADTSGFVVQLQRRAA